MINQHDIQESLVAAIAFIRDNSQSPRRRQAVLNNLDDMLGRINAECESDEHEDNCCQCEADALSSTELSQC